MATTESVPQARAEDNQAQLRKLSGEEMLECPLLHVDEAFWMAFLAYSCYWGDFWVLGFVLLEPLGTWLAVKRFTTPGDPSRACNNMVPVDTRTDGYTAPQSVIEAITNQGKIDLNEDDRPNTKWVHFFYSALAPDSMARFDKKAQRLLAVFAQGGEYLPKASNVCLFAMIFSFAMTGWTLSWFGLYRALKFVAIMGSHINLAHIFRDHSVSGYTHHGAHNVGEYDKKEFVVKLCKETLTKFVLSRLFAHFFFESTLLNTVAAVGALKACALANHTLCHYTPRDIKGKGPGRGLLWRVVMDTQRVLSACKLVTSREYHSQHHFRNEMAYPAILITFNEFWNSNSLRPFLTRRMDAKSFIQIEKITAGVMFCYLYAAVR